ncbi:MAG: nitrite reductase [Candidatus Thiodiazotropha lotti]|uniref:Nitrite reductase n=1 Tax=Candidatus Thiodiazotropha lotti TaxID=2792787 RepID=A0A9E4N2L8_9GAMM|nr:nitrite reductase [Candidatus Thiodiazotropha lotti]ODC01236.1 nitrite reductase [Candidatus Thiodiazotropha endoloripes]MCG7930061.1 nitrite reductase [Candidatus Thiodiazotropha lotti]MCG7940759.1 nitrite reductase [Candidatus Thiodiazotropha lotti]MCG7988941.1 nitrite reductase [Candidatus Thiodiazotropha lotti]
MIRSSRPSVRTGISVSTLSLAISLTIGGAGIAAQAATPTLSEADFEASKTIYFQRCAGCHGTLRKGATGKSLEPKETQKLGQERLEKIIKFGTEGGMNNFDDIMTADEIKKMATYIQMEPPIPPEMSLALMKERHKVFVDPKDYPSKPLHGRNWKNFFLVIERDVGKVAIIDGDKKEVVAHVPTGYAVHVLKAAEHHKSLHAKDAGRFWYTQGRDGKLTKIDLWQTPDKMKVAEVQIAYDARDVAVSGDGKYVVGGGYWPPHFVIADAHTMEPLKVVSARGVNVDGNYVNESRVAAIYDTPNHPSWLVSMKELGQMWQVDYSDIDNLKITKMDTAKFLHDGFYDPTGRYFQIAANASNKMVVVDTETQKLTKLIDVDKLPHPGPGANWIDPKCGPVGGTVHLGVGKVTAWGNDPKGHPDQAWKVCYETETDGPGVFIRTHPKSDYVWADQTKHPEPEVQQSVQVIDKKTREIIKTIRLTDKPGYAAVHMEFNADGTEVWTSVWNRKDSKEPNGEIIIFDAKTLEEKARVKGLFAPTGKFNVHNRINHVT